MRSTANRVEREKQEESSLRKLLQYELLVKGHGKPSGGHAGLGVDQ